MQSNLANDTIDNTYLFEMQNTYLITDPLMCVATEIKLFFPIIYSLIKVKIEEANATCNSTHGVRILCRLSIMSMSILAINIVGNTYIYIYIQIHLYIRAQNNLL